MDHIAALVAHLQGGDKASQQTPPHVTMPQVRNLFNAWFRDFYIMYIVFYNYLIYCLLLADLILTLEEVHLFGKFMICAWKMLLLQRLILDLTDVKSMAGLIRKCAKI